MNNDLLITLIAVIANYHYPTAVLVVKEFIFWARIIYHYYT